MKKENGEKMSMEELLEFCRNQNRTFKVDFTGQDLKSFIADWTELHEHSAEEILESSGLVEAKIELARIMAL